MRWTTPLLTVVSLAALGGIVWHARGPELLDALPGGSQQQAKDRLPVTTLVEMDNEKLRQRLDWSIDEVETNRAAFSSYSTASAEAYVGSDEVSKEDASRAITRFRQRLATAHTQPSDDRGYIDNAPQHVGLRGGGDVSRSTSYSPNSSANDFKYIPRMQRFGLTRLYRFGRVNSLGGRDMIDRTRLGQQQRELDRLRSRRDARLSSRRIRR